MEETTENRMEGMPICECISPEPSNWFGYECLCCFGFITEGVKL